MFQAADLHGGVKQKGDVARECSVDAIANRGLDGETVALLLGDRESGIVGEHPHRRRVDTADHADNAQSHGYFQPRRRERTKFATPPDVDVGDDGGSCLLYIGGIAELFKSCTIEERLYLKGGRKGFIKLVLQTDSDVVPVYLFGNTSVLSVLRRGPLTDFSRRFGVSLTYFWGKFNLPIPRDEKVSARRSTQNDNCTACDHPLSISFSLSPLSSLPIP